MRREPKSAIGKVVHERIERDWFRVRKYAVNRYREGKKPDDIAGMLGVSQSVVYKWIKIWHENKTWESLRDKSSRPKTIQVKKWEYYQLVVDARKAHPDLGPQKLKAYLGIDLNSMGIYEILVAAGLIQPGPKVRRRWRSFARRHSNSLWQMDIKTLKDGGPYLFSIMDDHSRAILASKKIDTENADEILSVLLNTIRMFGKPRQILTDHGAQFYANKGGTSRFDELCAAHGIKHILAGVRRPTTIGKIERWHRTVKYDLLVGCKDIDEFCDRLPGFIEWYNLHRPHWGLDLRTPFSVYFADFITDEEIKELASFHEVHL